MRCFHYAVYGIVSAYKSERNLRIHSAAAFFAVCAGIICEISPAEWLAVIVCIGAVISAELFNTAIEAACDEVTKEKSDNIRRCKDCAAGAVLVFAIASAAVGFTVFLQPENIMTGIERFEAHPYLYVAVGASLAFFIKIIFFTWRKTDDK